MASRHSATQSSSVLPPSRLQQGEEQRRAAARADRRRAPGSARAVHRRRGPMREASLRRGHRLARNASSASATSPIGHATRRRQHRTRCASRSLPPTMDCAARTGLRRDLAEQIAQSCCGRRTPRPANCAAPARTDRAAAEFSDAAPGRPRRSTALGRFNSVAIGISGLAETDTNEVFAPFSRSRRTR